MTSINFHERDAVFSYTGTQTITFKLRIEAKSREKAEEKFKKIWLNSHIDQDCWWDIEQEGIKIIYDNFDDVVANADWRIED
jgi:hypothetical protein